MREQSPPPPRTPGAKRAGDGEYLFDLAKVNHILGGPDYSTANGACVEGDRMIVGLMRMPAGTGADILDRDAGIEARLANPFLEWRADTVIEHAARRHGGGLLAGEPH